MRIRTSGGRRARPARRAAPGTAAAAGLAVAAFALAACAAGAPPAPAAATTSTRPGRDTTPGSAAGSGTPATGPTNGRVAPGTARPDGGVATLAFAGDVHFEGSAAAALTGRLGSAFGVLRSADLAVLNLETAVTQRGSPEPKEFTFRAPARALGVLKEAGVDAVSIANNHGMDYGRTGLQDTLTAARRYGMPLLGAGPDDAAAWTPLRRELHGVRVSVVAATDVLDDFARSTWVARPGAAGLATAKDTERLLAAVRAERPHADVVVVFLHWGLERSVCPTARQLDLARRLAAAGADVVVGSHAHVVQPRAVLGRTLVAYGLGNFQFYASGGAGARSGVLTVEVGRGGVTGSAWHPATITGGAPELLAGAAAAAREQQEETAAAHC